MLLSVGIPDFCLGCCRYGKRRASLHALSHIVLDTYLSVFCSNAVALGTLHTWSACCVDLYRGFGQILKY